MIIPDGRLTILERVAPAPFASLQEQRELVRAYREREVLRTFAREVLESWSDGDLEIDTSDVVELATNLGMLEQVSCATPCSTEFCQCLEYGAAFPVKCLRFAPVIANRPSEICTHQWVDLRNGVIVSGEMCSKCTLMRAGNAATEHAPDGCPK